MNKYMTGGLMQLVAYGAQDVYLTGNPMITYFKVVYRRHTNFAMESIEQFFNGTADLGTSVSALISRNGDLISSIYLQTILPSIYGDTSRWIDNVGHFLIKKIDLEIGGQLIDTQYGDWLEIWSQLTVPAGQKQGYLEMIGQSPIDAFSRLTGLQADVHETTIGGRNIFVPLQFWFCRNIGLALPLIALQYHEVKINISFQTFANLTRGSNPTTLGSETLSNTSLWVDYIYLDTDERRRFSQVSHEYLIEQIQYNNAQITCGNSRISGAAEVTNTIKLNFNHPVKELVWVIRNDQVVNTEPSNFTSTRAIDVIDQTAVGTVGNLTTAGLSTLNTQAGITELIGQSSIAPPGGQNPVITGLLRLNGHDRFTERPGDYFNLVQPEKFHTAVPESPGINVYSFALNPEHHQPSGSCNFSRIDNAYLVLVTAVFTNITNDYKNYPGIHHRDKTDQIQQHYANGNSKIHIYAVNYNVLRIASGLAGLAYSN